MKINKTKLALSLIIVLLLLMVSGIIWNGWLEAIKSLESVWTDLTPEYTPIEWKAPRIEDISVKGLSKDEIVWRIYGLESSYGKNDGCKRQGKFNGFGFGQHETDWQCFKTFEEASQAVHNWVASMQAQGYDMPTLVCYYNTGKLISNCSYYQKFLALK